MHFNFLCQFTITNHQQHENPKILSFDAFLIYSSCNIEHNVHFYHCLVIGEVVLAEFVACFYHLRCNMANEQQKVPQIPNFTVADSKNIALCLFRAFLAQW